MRLALGRLLQNRHGLLLLLLQVVTLHQLLQLLLHGRLRLRVTGRALAPLLDSRLHRSAALLRARNGHLLRRRLLLLLRHLADLVGRGRGLGALALGLPLRGNRDNAGQLLRGKRPLRLGRTGGFLLGGARLGRFPLLALRRLLLVQEPFRSLAAAANWAGAYAPTKRKRERKRARAAPYLAQLLRALALRIAHGRLADIVL